MKAFQIKRRPLPQHELNITSLLDILTILLFFLVQSISVSDAEFSVKKGIRLPESDSQTKPQESLVLIVSQDSISTKDETLVNLSNGKVPNQILASDGRTILPLEGFLKKQLAKRENFFKEVGDASQLGLNQILIQADRDIPFSLLKYVFFTTANAGFGDYQFLVTQR